MNTKKVQMRGIYHSIKETGPSDANADSLLSPDFIQLSFHSPADNRSSDCLWPTRMHIMRDAC